MDASPFEDRSPSSEHRGSLRFLVRFPRECYAWLGLSGELDVSNADVLSSVLDAIHAAGAETVEIDASEVDFAGCAFLDVIGRHARFFENSGGWLVVSAASRSVQRLFELAGCSHISTVAETIVERPTVDHVGD